MNKFTQKIEADKEIFTRATKSMISFNSTQDEVLFNQRLEQLISNVVATSKNAISEALSITK